MRAELNDTQRRRNRHFFCDVILNVLTFAALAGCAANNSSQQSASSTAVGGDDAFSLADANHDGKLSREEAGDYLVYVVFLARDTNHDGRLTQQEWGENDPEHVAAFRNRDYNQDGVVTMEEAIIYGRQGGGGVALVRAADKNRDGKVDRAELQAYLASHAAPSD